MERSQTNKSSSRPNQERQAEYQIELVQVTTEQNRRHHTPISNQ